MATYYLSFDPPTSVNKMYAPKRYGGIRLTDVARNWKLYAELTAQSQWEGKSPLNGRLCVTYRFFGTTMDWDNPCKILGDSMNKIVYFDDSQIVEAHIYLYREEKDDPRVDVEIQTIG